MFKRNCIYSRAKWGFKDWYFFSQVYVKKGSEESKEQSYGVLGCCCLDVVASYCRQNCGWWYRTPALPSPEGYWGISSFWLQPYAGGECVYFACELQSA